MNSILSLHDGFSEFRSIPSHLVYGDASRPNPDACIMIPTFRRADTLKLTVNSAINQKGNVAYDIIVVDNDADTDPKTDALMKSLTSSNKNVLYYRNEQNIGMCGNWNRCIELSRSEVFCILHDDDQILPNYLEQLLPIAKSVEFGAIGVFNRAFYFPDGYRQGSNDRFKSVIGKIRGNRLIPFYLKDAVTNMRPSPTACFYNKRACLEIGGFSFDYIGEGQLNDNVFFCRMCTQWRVYVFPQILALRGIGDNVSYRAVYDVTVGDYELNQVIIERDSMKHKRLYHWLAKCTVCELMESYKKSYQIDIDKNLICQRLHISDEKLRINKPLVKMIQILLWVRACCRQDPRRNTQPIQ